MTRDDFIALCNKQIKLPYLWGMSGPGGYDCSGLACWALDHLGVPRHHNRATGELYIYFVKAGHGAPVAKSDIQLGDLCFYTDDEGNVDHVTIGWGAGEVFEAGRGDHTCTTVQRAREMKAEVMISTIDRHPNFKCVTRPKDLHFDG